VALATASDRERFLRLRKSRRFRDSHKACVLQGGKLVLEAMRRRGGAGGAGKNNTPVRRVFLSADLVDDYARGRWEKRAAQLDVPVRTVVNAADMRKMTGMDRVDVVAECCAPPRPLLDAPGTWPAARPRSVLVLDGVQDPGNVGTLIRTAYLLGWDMVGVGKGTADPFNDKCLRAAAGAAWDMPLFCGEIGDLCAFLAQGGPVVYAGADQSAGSHSLSAMSQQLAEMRKAREQTDELLESNSFKTAGIERQSPDGETSKVMMQGDHPTFCLVLGNEGKGLLSATPGGVQDIGPVTIPIAAPEGGLDSLGVASAGAILMHVLGHQST
jgi:tRNA G18 (ribose-2'-O)-methylase SpoU